MTLTYGSIFSGIGGFDRGFDRAGMTCKWQIEIDKDATKVLERHYPDVARISDVRDAGRHNLAPVDLIAFGWPCTDLSVAGLREGLSGERSGLFFEAVRIISELRPQWIVAENVPGLFSSYTPIMPPPSGVEVGTEWEVEEDSDCENVIASLIELGYGLSWRVCDGQFWGVAQRRERVFFVGSLGTTSASEVFPFAESVPGDFETRGEARRGVADAPEDGSGISGGYRMTAFGEYVDDNTASCMAARDFKSATDLVVGTLAASGKGKRGWQLNAESARDGHIVVDEVSLPLRSGGNDRHAADLQTYGAFSCQDSGADVGEISPTLRSMNFADSHINGGGQVAIAFGWNKSASQTMRVDGNTTDSLQASPQSNPAIAFTERSRAGGRQFEAQEELAYALTNPGSGGQAHSSRIASGYGVRRLTPRECEILQGFPPDWTLYAADGSIISDSSRYRMIGNSIITHVAEWIGRRILESL